jgi:hypothetical protein
VPAGGAHRTGLGISFGSAGLGRWRCLDDVAFALAVFADPAPATFIERDRLPQYCLHPAGSIRQPELPGRAAEVLPRSAAAAMQFYA